MAAETTNTRATPGSGAGGSETHFARRATGFVRDVRIRDAVIFNVLPAAPGLTMAVSVFVVLSTFANVNIYVCILIAALSSFLVSGAFGLLSQIMPRSGADYVLISRSLHPALGIGSSILIGVSSILAAGYWGVFTSNVAIGPMVTLFGVSVKSHGIENFGVTLTQHPWNMIVGGVEVVLLVALMILGTRLIMRLQFGLFLLAVGGFLFSAIVFLFTTHGGFIHDYNNYARPFTHQADTYHYFLTKAAAGGIAVHGGTNWHNTIIASGAFIAFGVFTWWSANLAGEIRQAGTRKTWYTMLGGLSITFGSILVMVVLMYHAVGHDFLTAVNGISADPKTYTLPNAPWWITFVAVIVHSPVLVLLLGLSFIAWAPLIVYIQIVQPVRALFAWAFDGVIPQKLATVSRRTHTPVVALLLVGLIIMPALYLAAYTTTFLTYVALSVIVAFPTFLLVGTSAIVFPFRRRAAYLASSSNITVLGLPLLVYFGIGTIAVGLFGGWLFLAHAPLGLPGAGKNWTDQLFTSPGKGGLALCATCLLVGAAIYGIARLWRRSQGIDLSLNYLEIPPE